MTNQLNPEAKIFVPQTKPFGCANTLKIPLTLKNLNIHNSFKCIATNISGNNIGSQCLNTKIDGFDYCFLHKDMVDSEKYFLLLNKRKSKNYSNSYTCSTESPLSFVSTYYDINNITTYSASVSDKSTAFDYDEKETFSTTSTTSLSD